MKDIRILLADDDKEIRNLLKIYLERELYMVDTAINAKKPYIYLIKITITSLY